MPPKRSHQASEANEQPGASTVNAADSNGTVPTKRRRGHVRPNSDGDDSNPEETQESDAEEKLEDLEEFIGSQHSAVERLEQRLSQASDTCAEAGVIETVTLVDFMCHENLSIDLGPNMNFIIGHNGSGKSAILTAITGMGA